MHQTVRGLSLSLALVVGLMSSAQAGLLGTSPNYSVTVFGDMTQSNVDSTGRLAVMGNLTVSGFGVGSALATNGDATLVVGGNLSFTNGQVYHGDARVGGTASVSGFGIPNGTLYYNAAGNPAPPFWVPQQQTPGGGISPTFFSSSLTYANALSSTLTQTAPTGSASINLLGKITLAAGLTGLNVFNITADQFAGASGQGINISGQAGATVVVNVIGTGASVLSASNFAFGISGGLNRDHIVYNFSGISEFNSTNLGIQGSILAPKTAFKGVYGNVDGDVVVASVTGSTEFHNVPFQGTLPTPATSTPEPGTIAGALLGLAAFGLWKRLQK